MQDSPSLPRARILANLHLPPLPGFATRTFGDYLPPQPPGAPAWRAENERRNLVDILPLIPAAEKPDLLLCASPEYLPIPWDLHTFPGPKVLLITDWNVCLRFLPDLCRLFDYCFTDWPGYRLLRRSGVANVFHQPLFGHAPEVFRLLDPAPPRDLDLSFCGNLNSGLHGERNRLVAQAARWGHRTGRPVQLRPAFNQAYIETLNRSRLVFNYAIRGEANMRLFEAMACGAVPLVEDTNQEVAILFQEGRHYFRYAPGRLEERLDELLSQPERIAAVAAEARLEVGRHTKASQYAAALETVLRESPVRPATATVAPLGGATATSAPDPAPRSRKALAKMRVLGMAYSAREAILEIQSRTECPGLEAEALPGLLFAVLERDPAAAEAARKALGHMLGNPLLPETVRLFLHLQLARQTMDWGRAATWARQCLTALSDANPADLAAGGALYTVLLPPVDLGKGMNSDLNKAFLADLRGDPGNGGRALLEAHVRFALAEASLGLGDARGCLAEAGAARRGDFASLPWWRLLTEAAVRAGDAGVLREVLPAWFAEAPLDTAAWERILAAYDAVGDAEGALRFLEGIAVLAEAFLDADQTARIRNLARARRAALPGGAA